MKLGMNMLLWSDDVTDPSYLSLFEMLKEAGYDGIEVPIFALDPSPYEALGRQLVDLGLEALALTAGAPGTHPLSGDPLERKRATERNLRALECAHALGATILGGPHHAAPVVFSGERATDAERGWAIEALRTMADAADPLEITLAVEHLDHFEHYFSNTAAQTAALCRDVGRPRCRMLYDTFHAHLEEKDVRSAIESASDMIAYVHLSENDRSTPGSGQVAWQTTFETLHAIGYDGWMTVEAFGGNPDIARAMKIWRQAYESESQLASDAARFARAGWAAPTA
jgi:D-psicose/D-tagatose/L-ribulose 3-epimerase